MANRARIAAILPCVALILGAAAAQRVQSGDSVTMFSGTQGITWPRSGARQSQTWFRRWSDLVFLGRFESWSRDTSRGSAPLALVRCRVDSVLLGFCADTCVTFVRLVDPSFAPERLLGRPRVLGALSRACTPSGTDCGSFFLIGDDGTLLSDYVAHDTEQAALTDRLPLRVQDLGLEGSSESGLEALLRRGDGLATVVLREVAHIEPVRVPMRDVGLVRPCEEAKWVMQTDAPLPKYVRLITRGLGSASDADRFLIPVPNGFRGDTLFVDCDPKLLAIKGGMVRALGLSVDQLHDWLKPAQDGGLMLVRP